MRDSNSQCCVCGQMLVPWFSRHGRDVYRCPFCRHIQVPAGIAQTDSGKSIYEEENASIFEGEGTAEYYFDEGATDAAERKLKFVTRWANSGGQLLDIGANYGQFLFAASTAFQCAGLEPNPSAVAWSRSNLKVNNAVGSIYNLSPHCPEPVQVMTAWDVIEHLDDPRRALAECRRNLEPGGWIFLSTPDAGSIVGRIMGHRWHYQDPVQHINLLSRYNLDRLLRESGFRVAGHITFGRSYRVSYIVSRLIFLLEQHPLGAVVRTLRHLPLFINRAHVSIKLWDVVGVAAQAK